MSLVKEPLAVMPGNLNEPNLSSNALTVLKKRYLHQKRDGKTAETPKEMFWRVAAAVAQAEKNYPDSRRTPEEMARAFYDLLTSFKFLPNSPTLMNAGSELGQLAACFVLPVGDSIEEIFDAVKYAALIHKSGGGTGFSFSRIRPQKSRVGSTGGVASGPVSFMRIFNTATEQIKQGGTRRGANMGILRADHPDILEFINCKKQEGELNNFNISVALTEEFMQAVKDDQEYSLVDPHTKEIKERLPAKEVFSILVQNAWESGDPGIIFLDRINRDNPVPSQGEIESTNPCGEQPLLPYEACNLGSINLTLFYNPGLPQDSEQIDWAELRRIVHLSVRFLDNVIDVSVYPLEQISKIVRLNRKIGLGVMGFADLLYRLRIPYNSEKALNLAEKIMEFILTEGRIASAELAKERGPFPAYPDSIYPELGFPPLRNATITTIAPTGTLSILADCSSGIEPLFALSFVRNVLDGEKLLEVNPYFEEALHAEGLHSPELMEEVARIGRVSDRSDLPEEIQNVFVTAMDFSPEWHVRMQAAFQRHTDNAVSKTVNLPNSATIEDITAVYNLAYELGCKGVTVYRDGCKSIQVLSTGTKEEPGAEGSLKSDGKGKMTRPDVIYGFTQKVRTGMGELYLTVNEANGRPFEVFATIGKSGRSVTAKAEAIGRLVSLALRSGVEVSEIVAQLKGIGGESPVFQKKRVLHSIPDAVSWVLESHYLQGKHVTPGTRSLSGNSCPECGEDLIFEEGCSVCKACGYTKCA